MRSRFRRTRRDRSRPSLHVRLVRVITFDPHDSIQSGNEIAIVCPYLHQSFDAVYTKTLSFCHSTNDENYIAKMHTRVQHSHEFFLDRFPASMDIAVIIYYLIRNCPELSEFTCEASEEEHGTGQRWGTERREMTNVDGMRIHSVLVCRATFPRPLPEV